MCSNLLAWVEASCTSIPRLQTKLQNFSKNSFNSQNKKRKEKKKKKMKRKKQRLYNEIFPTLRVVQQLKTPSPCPKNPSGPHKSIWRPDTHLCFSACDRTLRAPAPLHWPPWRRSRSPGETFPRRAQRATEIGWNPKGKPRQRMWLKIRESEGKPQLGCPQILG